MRPDPRLPLPSRPPSSASCRAAVVTAALGLLLAGCAGAAAGGGGTASPRATTTGPSASPSSAASTTGSATTTSGGPVSQAGVLASLPGPADGACADTTQRNVRSGSIGAGDFVDARKTYKDGGTGSASATVSLHIIPADPGTFPGVSMTMTRQRNPVVVHTYTSTTHESAGGVSYYVLTFPVTEPGPWKLEVSSGTDRGCFLVAFNRPA